ncbi:hypothetical protein EUA98_12540 [Pengzhenrongella frigida]|uniref:Uncharacterized protein n=1 Tax=Pengzhenrongella frigida TaxID=1259133 RepID=A0A4Q5N0E4_9MICO|nr:hypothetical protein [Cellulomonas sp. HLT2-17]RYV50683.1 hypothetical protein EUA98_12540 [Cellulomonas sp. HLT2-17]
MGHGDATGDGVTTADEAGGATADTTWRARRRDAAAEHADALERRQAGQSLQARALIQAFVREATARGVPSTPLLARSYDGRARYRTAVRGWYLRRNESVAVGTDGEFYILTVPASLRARLRGATPQPSDPPLILGKGGRDGESIDLADALDRALTARS